MKDAFALFQDDGKGPLWRGFFDDLEDAKRKGQVLAAAEATEFFVFNVETNMEVVRFHPRTATAASSPVGADA